MGGKKSIQRKNSVEYWLSWGETQGLNFENILTVFVVLEPQASHRVFKSKIFH